MTTALVPKDETRGMTMSSAAMRIQDIVEQKKLVSQVVTELMKKDEHYGVIPGAKKPSLWKPGADLLCSLFQLEADYVAEEIIHEPGYIYYRYKCVLTHIPTGRRVGAGLGSCNSREEKYVRAGAKKCPNCEKETILRSRPRNKKEEENPDSLGWFCWAKKGGCGRNFTADDPTVTQQDTAPKDPSDLDNTILKMACKRSRIDAVLTVTSASDFFTQDLEDLTEKAAEYTPPPQAKEGSAKKGDDGPILNVAETVAVSAASRAATANTASTTATSTTTGNPETPSPATMTSKGTGTAPTKPPRANTIKHDGTFASHKQVTLLHIMRSKVGGLVFCDDKDPCYVFDEMDSRNKQAVKILCAYHKQLAAFKDCDGKAITTSTDLSEDQISNLIDRYDAKIQQQERRAAEDPDLGAAFDQAEENARIRGELGPGSDG